MDRRVSPAREFKGAAGSTCAEEIMKSCGCSGFEADVVDEDLKRILLRI